MPPASQDPLEFSARLGVPLSSITVSRLGPVIAALGALWSPIVHASGLSGRDPVVALCLVGAMKLVRRRVRSHGRWDAVSGGVPGRRRPGAW